MKKTDIALIAVVIAIIILGAIFFGKSEAKPTYDYPLSLGEEVGLIELTYAEYESKIESGEPFLFIIERTTCSHCQNFMPLAEEVANEYGIPMYYIDTDKFEGDEFTSLEKSNSFFKKNSGKWGTPTTMLLIGSDAPKYLQGEADKDGLYDFLKDIVVLNKE